MSGTDKTRLGILEKLYENEMLFFDEFYVQSNAFRAGSERWLHTLHSYYFLSVRVTYHLNDFFHPFWVTPPLAFCMAPWDPVSGTEMQQLWLVQSHLEVGETFSG